MFHKFGWNDVQLKKKKRLNLPWFGLNPSIFRALLKNHLIISKQYLEGEEYTYTVMKHTKPKVIVSCYFKSCESLFYHKNQVSQIGKETKCSFRTILFTQGNLGMGKRAYMAVSHNIELQLYWLIHISPIGHIRQ